jgi:succinate dehydrogenase / fumarate reductase flavoprotein subunit
MLSSRDIVARAIFEKIQNSLDIFLDLRHLDKEEILQTMPQEYNLALKFENLYLDKNLIPIKPLVHYTMGGIDVDINSQTSIKNLFAVGECANHHTHGANRLGGNSLLEVISFGRKLGKYLGSYTNTYTYNSTQCNIKKYENNIKNILQKEIKIDFYNIKDKLGKELFYNAGIFRDKDKLQTLLRLINSYIDDLKYMGVEDKDTYYNTNLKEYLEFEHSLTLAKVICSSALKREESRGAHFRIDFQNEDKKFQKDTIYEYRDL